MRMRIDAPELVDDPSVPREALVESFREVWGVNRYLGGMAVLKRYLRPWLAGRSMTMLDVAAGTGEVALGLHRWAARRGTPLRITLLDRSPEVLAIARERTAAVPGVALIPGDARHLPFGDHQFDLAICNLALHHFSPADAAQVLRELDRVSRIGWVVGDLERHPLAYTAARILAGTLWRSPVTRHDGPLSVRRSYRAEEVREMVRQAGVQASVLRCFPFRLAVVGLRR